MKIIKYSKFNKIKKSLFSKQRISSLWNLPEKDYLTRSLLTETFSALVTL